MPLGVISYRGPMTVPVKPFYLFHFGKQAWAEKERVGFNGIGFQEFPSKDHQLNLGSSGADLHQFRVPGQPLNAGLAPLAEKSSGGPQARVFSGRIEMISGDILK